MKHVIKNDMLIFTTNCIKLKSMIRENVKSLKNIKNNLYSVKKDSDSIQIDLKKLKEEFINNFNKRAKIRSIILAKIKTYNFKWRAQSINNSKVKTNIASSSKNNAACTIKNSGIVDDLSVKKNVDACTSTDDLIVKKHVYACTSTDDLIVKNYVDACTSTDDVCTNENEPCTNENEPCTNDDDDDGNDDSNDDDDSDDNINNNNDNNDDDDDDDDEDDDDDDDSDYNNDNINNNNNENNNNSDDDDNSDDSINDNNDNNNDDDNSDNDKLSNFNDKVLNNLVIVSKVKKKFSINIEKITALINKADNISKDDLGLKLDEYKKLNILADELINLI